MVDFLVAAVGVIERLPSLHPQLMCKETLADNGGSAPLCPSQLGHLPTGHTLKSETLPTTASHELTVLLKLSIRRYASKPTYNWSRGTQPVMGAAFPPPGLLFSLFKVYFMR